MLNISCNIIKNKITSETSFPELGTIGLFEKYITEDISREKSILEIDRPILVRAIKNTKQPRKIFRDSLSQPETFLTLEIIDRFGVLDIIGEDKNLLGYLKANPEVRLVTGVDIQFTDILEKELLGAEEVYLVQHKETGLSLELRDQGKTTRTIEFAEGKILDFKASSFCWGSKKGYKVSLVDLVDASSECGEDSYKSHKRAKKRTEFSFQ